MKELVMAVRSVRFDAWDKEDPINPKKVDIEEAKAVMKVINDHIGESFTFEKELDLIRTGHFTNKSPEASFYDATSGKRCVIEIKRFPYEMIPSKTGVFFKKQKLYKWFLEIHKKYSDVDTRIVFEFKIKNQNIDPMKAISDMRERDLFEGFSNEYIEFKAKKWHRPDSLWIGENNRIDFDEYSNEFLIIEENESPVWEIDAINDAIDYDRYADILFQKWTDKKNNWDEKFQRAEYKDNKKFLYLKLLLGFGKSQAVMKNDYFLKEFGETFLKKYGYTQSIRQLNGILLNVENLYQFVELNEGVLHWYPVINHAE